MAHLDCEPLVCPSGGSLVPESACPDALCATSESGLGIGMKLAGVRLPRAEAGGGRLLAQDSLITHTGWGKTSQSRPSHSGRRSSRDLGLARSGGTSSKACSWGFQHSEHQEEHPEVIWEGG